MKTIQKVLIAGLVLVVLSYVARSFESPAALGRGGPKREERIVSGQKKINAFKKSFNGSNIARFSRKLNKMVRDFELNNDVHVVRSSVQSDGPIVIK